MAAPSNRPVRVTTTEATALINPTTRNDVYSNLVSNGGIRAIESSWEQTLQSIGWFDRFEAYTRHLLRTGEATTMDQVWAKVDAKIKESPALSRTNGANGVNGHSNSNGNSNGNGSGNGTLTDSDTDEFDLRIPDDTLKAMVKATRGELDKFVQVTWDEDLSSTPATTDNPQQQQQQQSDQSAQDLPADVTAESPLDIGEAELAMLLYNMILGE